jgi:hypothetical protein
MREYVVGYDGFFTVSAKNEEEAYKEANKVLSKKNLPNDGNKSEWYLTEAEEVE